MVDAKRYASRPALRAEKLSVAGRDRTPLIDAIVDQVEQVRCVVGEGTPVVGALCFIDADWPLIGGEFAVRDAHVLWPKRLAARLAKQVAGPVNVRGTRDLLAARFPPASGDQRQV